MRSFNDKKYVLDLFVLDIEGMFNIFILLDRLVCIMINR